MQEIDEREARNHLPSHPVREFARGVLRTGGVLGAFVAFGLSWSVGVSAVPTGGASGQSHPSYAPAVSDEAPDLNAPQLWLIDGYNVVCANLLGGRSRAGWWRSEYRIELLERLERFDDAGAELWVVFDGSVPEAPDTDDDPGRAQTIYAPSADDWLLEQVKANVATRHVAVVTGDRKVADRARHRGAEIVEPRKLLGRCTLENITG